MDIVALIESRKWVPLAALVITFAVRLLKSDTKIPIDIPPRWRIWLALALGCVSGVLEAVVTGTKWEAAIVGGLVSTGLAVLGQNIVIDSMRGGKEFVVPGLTLVNVPPSPGKPPSIKPIPMPPMHPRGGGGPTIGGGFGGMLLLALALGGCGLFWKSLDLAADKAKCVVENQDLPNAKLFVKCALEDPEDYLELLANARAATKKALARQAEDFATYDGGKGKVSERSDTFPDAGRAIDSGVDADPTASRK
jgi:hypothetical protein